MTQTEHYQLNQWSASDKVHHGDFNADNRIIDGALHTLDTSLSKLNTSLTTSLAGKLGHSQIIQTNKSDGKVYKSIGLTPPTKDWSSREYVCIVVHYLGMNTETTPLSLTIWGPDIEYFTIEPLSLPGYLIVLLPRHDGTKPAAGFIITDRFIPFSCPFSFNDISQLSYDVQGSAQPLVKPNVVAFAGA